jgi:rhodanese-related sulfurtransferase
MAEQDTTLILDIRNYESFGGQHIAGAYNIDVGGNFATFSGWVLPIDKDILLTCAKPEDAHEATMWLRRVGLDRTVGYLKGGMFAWATSGLGTSHVCQISSKELYDSMSEKSPLVLLDVRAPSEFEKMHIEGAINIPAPDLRTRHKELEPESRIAVMCSTGHRSSLSCSILKQHGFSKVHNVAGGITGYSAAGYAPECPICVIPHGPQFMGK